MYYVRNPIGIAAGLDPQFGLPNSVNHTGSFPRLRWLYMYWYIAHVGCQEIEIVAPSAIHL